MTPSAEAPRGGKAAASATTGDAVSPPGAVPARARPEDDTSLQGVVAQEAAGSVIAGAGAVDPGAEADSDEAPPESDEEGPPPDHGLLLAPPLPPAPTLPAALAGGSSHASAGAPATASSVAGSPAPALPAAGSAGPVDAKAPPTETPSPETDAAARAGTEGAPAVPAEGKTGFDALLAGMQAGAEAAAPPAVPTSASVTAPSGVTASQGAAPAQGAQPAPQAGAPPAPPPIPLGAVPMTIGLRSLAGLNRFAIRLDPVELGRIDVSLDLDKESGRARAHLVVDRPETLALLQRDAGSLQQALAQAGFDLAGGAGGGIDLSLRGEAGGGGRQGEPSSRGGSERMPAGRDEIAPLDFVPARPLRGLGGLDIRI